MMNFTVYAGIGILLVLTIIGVLILLRRNSFKSENSKRICIVAGTLQAVHIILYLTGLLEKIAQINVYIAFGICAVVSIIYYILLFAQIWIISQGRTKPIVGKEFLWTA